MDAFAPLHANLLLASQERAESFRLVASELTDYRLSWAHRCAAKTTVHRLTSARFRLYAMGYGDEVLIRPQIYPDFCLVHYALKAPIELTVDGQRVCVPEGGTLFCNPSRQVDLRWAPHCEQVILRVPTAMLQGAMPAQSDRTAAPSALPPYAVMAPLATQMWLTQLQAFSSFAHHAAQHPHLQAWLTQVETSMAQFLVDDALACGFGGASGCEGSEPQAVDPWRPIGKPHVYQRLERLRHFVDTHLDQPLSLHRLASEAATSPRQLTTWIQQRWQVSPMVWVRQRRLRALHRLLQTQRELDITQLALRLGFTHMGRLAAYYREAFGELPSDTRRKAWGGGPA